MSHSDTNIRVRVTCPHCWHVFPPEETLWVSAHPALNGDARLGGEHQRRFLPTRFDPSGNAIDSHGATCSELACPKCHLLVPRAMFEMRSLFYSILGSPGSGKSHLIATTTWQMRQTMGSDFQLSFSDADPNSNRLLNRSEEQLFFNESPNEFITLPKTEKQGELYDPVHFGDQTVWYPRPFVFSVQPLPSHPRSWDVARLSRAICLYDNAGEHFLPGGHSSISPATQHLTVSRGLIFLFDPTQHVKFREACQGKTSDPQMSAAGWSHRQDQVMMEAANRIRTQAGLAQNEKYRRPVVVAMTKLDAWQAVLGENYDCRADAYGPILLKNGAGPRDSVGVTLNHRRLLHVSSDMRELMSRLAPEFVNGAEGFAENVIYIPVSALGHSPTMEPSTGRIGIRPADISPRWAEVPLMYLLSLTSGGLIPAPAIRPGETRRH
ncbi:MAG: hypothetical protein ACE5KM_10245 [Planctomycetaceae bacterium]